jgi:hypothetical protein
MKTLERILFLIICAALGLFIGAVAAEAQVISNPTAVTFDHVDFSTADHYEGGYFALLVKADNTCDTVSAPAATASRTDNLGKPATTTGLGMTTNLVAKPIGCYVYKVRALDVSQLWSAWSGASGPFVRNPATPGNLAVK